ncbi:MAG: DUF695 domain-containing protein [Shinella sp.]
MAVKSEDVFFLASGEEDEKPLIFRSLSAVPTGVREADLPNHVAIVWPYDSQSNGMPNSDTNIAQIAFEDALETLDVNTVGRLVLIVTGNNRKEWHWYVKDFDDWMVQMNQMLEMQPLYPIEIMHFYEPDWALHKNFVEGVRAPH